MTLHSIEFGALFSLFTSEETLPVSVTLFGVVLCV